MAYVVKKTRNGQSPMAVGELMSRLAMGRDRLVRLFLLRPRRLRALAALFTLPHKARPSS
jgi:hypothetical protein